MVLQVLRVLQVIGIIGGGICTVYVLSMFLGNGVNKQ